MKFLQYFGWMELLFGGLLIVVGLVAFANPGFAVRWIVFLFGFTAIANGITNIMFYVGHRGWGKTPHFSVFSGIISILAGIVLLFNPVFGTRFFSFLFALWFISHSISRIANYGLIRRVTGSFVHVLSVILNSLCILLGIFMLLNPLLLSLTLGYLVAISFLVLGIDSVIEAFCRVRKRLDDDAVLEMESGK